MAMLATRERPAARDFASPPSAPAAHPSAAPLRGASQFVWPPPEDELDALEVVELRGLTPVVVAAVPAAVSPPVPARATVPAGVRERARVPRLAAIASMMLFAAMVGLLLGVRDTRRSMTGSYSRLRESVVAVREYVEHVGTAPAVTAGVKPARPASSLSPLPLRSRMVSVSPSIAATPFVVPQPVIAEPVSVEPVAVIEMATATSAVSTVTTLPALASPAPPRAHAAAAVVSTAAVEARVKQALARYQQAYDTLDARAAAASWPSVDVTALARAFANLKSQSLFFDRCTIDVDNTAASTATASCTGSTTAIRQVGSTTPVTRSLQWRFNLRRGDDEAWVIDTVITSRP